MILLRVTRLPVVDVEMCKPAARAYHCSMFSCGKTNRLVRLEIPSRDILLTVEQYCALSICNTYCLIFLHD